MPYFVQVDKETQQIIDSLKPLYGLSINALVIERALRVARAVEMQRQVGTVQIVDLDAILAQPSGKGGPR